MAERKHHLEHEEVKEEEDGGFETEPEVADEQLLKAGRICCETGSSGLNEDDTSPLLSPPRSPILRGGSPRRERRPDADEPPAASTVPPDDVAGESVAGHSSVEGTGLLLTVFLIVNAALGAGLLNFPRAFADAGGVAAGTAVQCVLLAFIVAALLVLAHCADQDLSSTLQDAMESACGRWGRRVTSACVAIYCFGTTITFLIIIADQFDRALASIFGHDFCHTWYLSRSFTMPACAILFILPMCYSKRIDFLKIPSAIGVLAIFYTVGLVVFEYYAPHSPDMFNVVQRRHDARLAGNWTDLFRVVPVICFGYQCHVSIIPIYSCMRRRTKTNFTVAAVAAVAICFLSYTLTGAFGLWTFGADRVAPDVLMNYSARRPEVMAAVAAMAAKTVTTYPILLFCGREAVVSLAAEAGGAVEAGGRLGAVFRPAVATAWFAASLAAALLVPNIGAVIQQLGSLAAVFIFVLPGAALLSTSLRIREAGESGVASWAGVAVAGTFVALGAFIFGVVFTQGLEGDGQGATKPICY